MSVTTKLTKKSKEELYNQHVGTGTIVYRSSGKEITYINFYISRKDGKMYSTSTGKLVEDLRYTEEND